MCSPELTRGMCQVCLGTLTPETTEPESDVHKGKCAVLAGISPPEHRERLDALIKFAHRWPHGSPQRDCAMRDYYRFVHSIAEVDHYDYSNTGYLT
jgi:hypothetical protein